MMMVLPLLLLTVALVGSAAAGQRYTCEHGTRADKVTPGVRLSVNEEHRVKRQVHQPIRFSTFSDSTITNDLPASKRDMITKEVMPSLLESLSNTLSVTRTQGPILLDRSCEDTYYLPEDDSTVRQCSSSCVTSVCGTVTIPDEHLKRCIECNGMDPPCSPGSPSTDGMGVSNTDYILYISANQNLCTASTIAFAGACQMESTLDRPIAGYINFCPNSLEETTRDFLYDVAKHEVIHALAFSSSLFPFWRNSTGGPRTPRDSSELPPVDPVTDMYVADPGTVTIISYTDWATVTGPVTHTVTVLVTEAVLREGKAHFGCESLAGVELENQGEGATALQHWEKRILGNEAMTGVFDFNPVFSRLTLALLEDSGWYTVDYSGAEPLVWGRGRGCGFIDQGCGNMLDGGYMEGNPFCGLSDNTLGCTLDGGSVAQCNLIQSGDDIGAEYRYLSGNNIGSLEIADYCPYYRQFKFASGRTGICTDPDNQPSNDTDSMFRGEDIYAETYGERSRCIRQGKVWSKSFIDGGRRISLSSQLYGGGCYEVDCSPTEGLTVYVRGVPFQCDSEEEHQVSITDGEFTYSGSIVCPSCAAVCGDNCPTTPTPTTPTTTNAATSLTESTVLIVIPLLGLSLIVAAQYTVPLVL